MVKQRINSGVSIKVLIGPMNNHGSISTLIYTSELILCFTICVRSATRHNIQIWMQASSLVVSLLT